MSIHPTFLYRDAAAAIDFLERAFGFETLARHDNEDGTVAHSELRFGDAVVMVGSGSEALQDAPDDFRAARVGIYLGVDDLDAHYERARAAGADVFRELQDTEYGSREYSARDLEGVHWHFGTYVPQPQAAAASPDSA
jgi:uncharacterized glyoxalase superfamily protein PhnB